MSARLRLGWLSVCLAAAPTTATASIIFGSPPGGPITLHDGSFGIDLNGDGFVDLTLHDQGAYGPGTNNLAGSWSHVRQAMDVGVYEGPPTFDTATAMEANQQVGPSLGADFKYSGLGIVSDAIIHQYYSPQNDLGDPVWTDGLYHFVGVDVLSGTDHHYAWVELSLAPSTTPTSAEPWYDVTLYDWAYDTVPNQPITIPEPSSMKLLALIAPCALLVWRRRAPGIGLGERRIARGA